MLGRTSIFAALSAAIALVALLLFPATSLRHLARRAGRPTTFTSTSKSTTALHARKHHARFGNFIDAVPRPKDPKMLELIDKLDLKKTEREQPATSTGADLRKTRTRDLKAAVLERPVELEKQMYPKLIPQRKWSAEEISDAIECLNLSYGKKAREDLTESERVGVVDWDKFDVHASVVVAGWESVQTRKKVYNWIKYHIKKREVLFEHDAWVWRPKPLKEKRQ